MLHENAELTQWTPLTAPPETLQLLVVPPAHAELKQRASSLLRDLESYPLVSKIHQISTIEWSVIGLDRLDVLARVLDSTVLSRRDNLVQLLLEKEACVHRPGDVPQPLHAAVAVNHVPTVRLLLNARADPNRGVDDEGKPALQLAAAAGSSAVVRLLLENGAAVNSPDLTEAPLHGAAAVGHFETVKYLLEAQAVVNHVGRGGKAALHFAAATGAGDVVRELIKNRAEVNQQDRNRKVSLQYAVSSDSVESVDALLKAGAAGSDLKIKDRQPLLHYALAASTEEMVSYILSQKADMHAQDPKGRVPLLVAAARSDPNFVKLIRSSTRQLKEDTDQALYVAAEKGNASVVQFLLKERADAAVKDMNGTTALHLAAAGGYEVVIRDLLHAKADAHCRDGKSRIPWDVCNRAAVSVSDYFYAAQMRVQKLHQ